MPKWAENMREKADLITVLTRDSAKGADAIKQNVLWWNRQK